MAIDGRARTIDFRVLLSVTRETSRRRLKMIVSPTTMWRQSAASVSMVNWKSW